MDVQRACLCKIIVDREMLPFVEAKIGREFFPNPIHTRVYNMVWEHYAEHGGPPTAEAVLRAYPTYELPTYPEPVGYYLNQLRQDRKKVILTEGIQKAGLRLHDDAGPQLGDDLELILRQALSQSAHEITQGRDSDLFLSDERIMTRLTERRDDPGYLRGIPTGWDGLDRITGGFREEQLITFIGTPKTGKSSMLLSMALAARMAGAPVLFMTFEMSTEEQEDRMVSLITGINLTKILTGMLTATEMKLIAAALRLKNTLAGFIISSDIASAITLSGVQAKVAQYQPRIVFVDGVYLMDDEAGNPKGSPQALTSLTRGFKRMAQNRRLPIVISTQALLARSKGGLVMDSVGYSSSFAQDSDVLLGVETTKEVPNLSMVKTIAQRSGPTGVVYMQFDWSAGMVQEIDANVYNQTVAQAMPPMGSGRGTRH